MKGQAGAAAPAPAPRRRANLDIRSHEKAAHVRAAVLAAGLGHPVCGAMLPEGSFRWLIDTGSGFDLVGEDDLTSEDFDNVRPAAPIEFGAANAAAVSDKPFASITLSPARNTPAKN